MADQSDFDHVTGKTTTGHEWDGIKELNTPLAALVGPDLLCVHRLGGRLLDRLSGVAVAVELLHRLCCIIRPAPTSRWILQAWKRVAARRWWRLGAASLADIENDPALLALARARGKTVFGDNCAPCHGSGAAGAKGYPNLNDDDWLWGGSLDQIMQTIQFGARSGNPKAHEGAMLAFARKESSSRTKSSPSPIMFGRCRACRPARGYDAAAGAKIFAENLYGMSRRSRQGKPGTRRAKPDRQDLALWLRRGYDHRDDHQRPGRRDCRHGPAVSTPPRSRRWRCMFTRLAGGKCLRRGMAIRKPAACRLRWINRVPGGASTFNPDAR